MLLKEHSFKRKANIKERRLTLDGFNVVETVLSMKEETTALKEALQNQLEMSVFNAEYLAELRSEINKMEGYCDALSSVAYMAGYDHYFFDGKVCEETFDEIPEYGIHDQHTWAMGEGTMLLNFVRLG